MSTIISRHESTIHAFPHHLKAKHGRNTLLTFEQGQSNSKMPLPVKLEILRYYVLLFTIYCYAICHGITILEFEDPKNGSAQLSYAKLSSKHTRIPIDSNFTICASIFVGHHHRYQTFFSVRKNEENGKDLWFSLTVEELFFHEGYNIAIYSSTASHFNRDLSQKVALRFFDWSHACLSLDTKTGRTIVAVNGVITHDSIFKDLCIKGPVIFHEKLFLGVREMQLGADSVDQAQSEALVTNVNIFADLMENSEMIQTTLHGMCTPGNHLSWEEMVWKLVGRVMIRRASDFSSQLVQSVCQLHDFLHTFVFPTHFNNWNDCIDFCPRMQNNGRVPFIENLNASQFLMEYFKKTNLTNELSFSIDQSNLFGIFAPFQLESGKFVDFYNNSPISVDMWNPGQPNGGENQPTTSWILNFNEYLLFDQGAAAPAICMCQFHQTPVLKLRGMCENSHVDRYFALSYNNGNIVFKGLTRTEMIFEENSLITLTNGQQKILTSKAIGSSSPYPLGKHVWKVFNGQHICTDDIVNESKLLKMTGCSDGYFTCNNGDCIPMNERCDQALNCADETDEMGCQILVLKNSYRKTTPPIKVTTVNREQAVIPCNVTVSITLLDVASIRESKNEIDLKFMVVLQWLDFRAVYYNLKNESSQNILDEQDVKNLWIPNLFYQNNKDNDNTKTALDRSDLKILRKGKFARSGLEVADEIEIFEGSENPIQLSQSLTKEFKCKYELVFFPFDTQVKLSCFSSSTCRRSSHNDEQLREATPKKEL